ncbi:tRNA pseudouridine(13) synthase TruD [Candidatus Micrarchaeota archaeon]|nr:tRNA pseudouridine(13) synthase TruD [Candidatus Micrarchaeota archaeon]
MVMALSYQSKTSGIGGTIKSRSEDFIVEEISSDGSIFEIDKNITHADENGKFTHFILQKKNWSTSSALDELGKRLGVGKKSLAFAGTKDKIAISAQLASVFNVPKEKLFSVRIKDIQINGAWCEKDKVRLGQLLGNQFTIRVDQPTGNTDQVKSIMTELDGKFPNYFGEQRFGSSRKNTHLIGEQIIRGDIEAAVRLFLCDTIGEKNADASAARKEFEDSWDCHSALKNYPKHLRLERTMLAYLEKHPANYPNALRALPRTTLLLFVHAFQSDLFNRFLSDRINKGELELEQGEYYCGETFGFPDISKSEAEGWIVGKLIGYQSPINDREKEMLENIGIDKEDFKIKQIPEIASKGTYRTLHALLKNFNFTNNFVFRFSLQAGSYATVAMREFLDMEKQLKKRKKA